MAKAYDQDTHPAPADLPLPTATLSEKTFSRNPFETGRFLYFNLQ